MFFYEQKDYFYKKIMRLFLSNIDDGLDFKNSCFKGLLIKKKPPRK